MITPILRSSREKSFVIYANSKALVEYCAEKYSNWLDTTTLQPDYLKLDGPMKKKEQQFYLTKFFCKIKHDTPSGDAFNPWVLFTTSGAANVGNNSQIYGVFRAEIPPSIEDCLKKRQSW